MKRLEHGLDLAVKDEHKGGTDGTESVGTGTLEESGSTLLRDDLRETIHGTLVEPLGLGLLGLHLETTTDGVHGVGSVTGSDSGRLGNAEGGDKTKRSLVALVRVDVGKGIVHTEVHATVRDDTGDGHPETVVQTHETGGTSGSLGKTVSKTVEGLLAGSDIRGKTGTGVIQRIDDAQGTCTSKTTGGHVDKEELTELGLFVVLGEDSLDDILKGEVEGLGREVTDHVGEVTSPEGTDTLLGGNATEAISNTSVTLDLTGLDQGVSILGLDDKLDTLNRGGTGLGHGTGDTTSGKVLKEGSHSVVGHSCSVVF